jgi:ribosomal protein uS2
MELLIPSEDYKKYRMNKGEVSRNKKLDSFLSWETPSGRNMFSIQSIDARIRIAAKFLCTKKNIVVVSSDLESLASHEFGKATGAKVIDRYRSSLFSNPKNKQYTEPEVIFVTNADENRNVIAEANLNNIPVVAFCNTNSSTEGIDLIVPINTTNQKSLEIALWLIANEIRKLRGESEVAVEVFSKGVAE